MPVQVMITWDIPKHQRSFDDIIVKVEFIGDTEELIAKLKMYAPTKVVGWKTLVRNGYFRSQSIPQIKEVIELIHERLEYYNNLPI